MLVSEYRVARLIRAGSVHEAMACDLNDAGIALIGISDSAGGFLPHLVPAKGKPEPLQFDANLKWVMLSGINNRGMVAGTVRGGVGRGRAATPEARTDAFVWQGGKVTVLAEDSGRKHVFAAGINAQGSVAGWASGSPYGYPSDEDLGFVWHKEKAVRLGAFRPTGINNRGDVIGNTCKDGHAGVLLKGGNSPLHLADLPNCQRSEPLAINDSGTVVGRSLDRISENTAKRFYEREYAVIWERGQPTKIPLPKSSWGRCTDINQRGDVVGQVVVMNDRGEREQIPFLYRDGEAFDLNSLVPMGGTVPADRLRSAVAINNRREILVSDARNNILLLAPKSG